jgi:hypothetical protein
VFLKFASFSLLGDRKKPSKKMKRKNYLGNCQRTISTQKLKLLGEVSRYDLYYSLTYLLK